VDDQDRAVEAELARGPGDLLGDRGDAVGAFGAIAAAVAAAVDGDDAAAAAEVLDLGREVGGAAAEAVDEQHGRAATAGLVVRQADSISRDLGHS
jgi:hypothetical protein